MNVAIVAAAALAAAAMQTSPPTKDPHAGRYTNGTGLPCAYCHGKTPHAEDMYRAAAGMAKMVTGINNGPLRRRSQIDCFSCHRAGGREHNMLHPAAIDRAAVEKIVSAWPGPRDTPEGIRRAMGRYSVSLGVDCAFCHAPGNWKADDKPQMPVARRMIALMDEFPKYFEFAKAAAFTCYTCHQGAALVPH
jgi:hypothetical protein